MLPRKQLSASAAASPARVQFEVIENPSIQRSVPSCDDCTEDYSISRRDDVPWFKPAGFYFRRSLRNAVTRSGVVEVGRIVSAELEHLAEWARQWDERAAIFELKRAQISEQMLLAAFTEHARAAALALCNELERAQRWVWDELELIPPRWISDPSEAEDKGWNSKAS